MAERSRRRWWKRRHGRGHASEWRRLEPAAVEQDAIEQYDEKFPLHHFEPFGQKAEMSKHGYTSVKPDVATEEMVGILMNGEAVDFHGLFATVYENLRTRRSIGGGEEMWRLRVYEKLQNLASQGLVDKSGKIYTPVVKALARRAEQMQQAREQAELRKAARRIG